MGTSQTDHADLFRAGDAAFKFFDLLDRLLTFSERADTDQVLEDWRTRESLGRTFAALHRACIDLAAALTPVAAEIEAAVADRQDPHIRYIRRVRTHGAFGAHDYPDAFASTCAAMQEWLSWVSMDKMFARPAHALELGEVEFRRWLQNEWESFRRFYREHWKKPIADARRDVELELEWTVEQRREPPPPPLSETERRVFEIIDKQPDGEGVTGPEIIELLRRQNFPIEQSTLTKHIIPKLKKARGVRNRRGGVGYYVQRNPGA